MRRSRSAQPGFTLIEATMASAVLLFVVVALTQSIVAGQQHTYAALHASRAVALADALLEEVISKPWDDPDEASVAGPEAGESTRADFDNLDDYHGYAEAAGALADAAGVAYGGLHQVFSRSVTVAADTPTDASLSSQAGQLVTVTVTDGSRTWVVRRFVAEATATGGGS